MWGRELIAEVMLVKMINYQMPRLCVHLAELPVVLFSWL